MKLFVQVLLVVASAASLSTTAYAKHHHGNGRDNGGDNGGYNDGNNNDNSNDGSDSAGNGNDAQIVSAVNRQTQVNFVEGSGMVVTQLLPDDTSGLTHQKWIVRLSNGKLIQAVYNTDMCPRVPLKVGDVVSMGGQFIWTNQGGLIHWLHHDPKGARPDGYVNLNGKDYCKD
jgi:hypothetical protein